MNIITIALVDMKRVLRDKKTLMYMLLLPIILISILGTALGSVFSVNSLEKINVGYINEDKGDLSKSFDEFLEYKEIKEILNYKKIVSLEEGQNLLEDKKISAIVHITKDYSKTLKENNETLIEIIGIDSGSFSYTVVKNVIESYIEYANSYMAISNIDAKKVEFKKYDVIKNESIETKGNMPRAIDYYAVTMMVMIILYGSSYGTQFMVELKSLPIGKRISAAPINAREMVIGKALAAIMSMSFQVLALIGFSKYVYKANFGEDMKTILFICFTLIVFSITLGVVLTSIFDNELLANKVLGLLIPISTLLSGGYFKISMSDSSILTSKMMYLSPSYLAQRALFSSIYKGKTLYINEAIFILWGFSIVFLLVSIIFQRKKEYT